MQSSPVVDRDHEHKDSATASSENRFVPHIRAKFENLREAEEKDAKRSSVKLPSQLTERRVRDEVTTDHGDQHQSLTHRPTRSRSQNQASRSSLSINHNRSSLRPHPPSIATTATTATVTSTPTVTATTIAKAATNPTPSPTRTPIRLQNRPYSAHVRIDKHSIQRPPRTSIPISLGNELGGGGEGGESGEVTRWSCAVVGQRVHIEVTDTGSSASVNDSGSVASIGGSGGGGIGGGGSGNDSFDVGVEDAGGNGIGDGGGGGGGSSEGEGGDVNGGGREGNTVDQTEGDNTVGNETIKKRHSLPRFSQKISHEVITKPEQQQQQQGHIWSLIHKFETLQDGVVDETVMKMKDTRKSALILDLAGLSETKDLIIEPQSSERSETERDDATTRDSERDEPSTNNSDKQKCYTIDIFDNFDDSPLPPVFVDVENKFTHEPFTTLYETPVLVNKEDVYDECFFNTVHSNFIAVHPSKDSEHVIISVKKQPHHGKYHVLKINKKGSEEFFIPAQDLTPDPEEEMRFSKRIKQYLATNGTVLPTGSEMSIYQQSNPNFISDLRMIEKKHPQKRTTLKIAFLYATGSEKVLQDFFDHQTASPRYWKFMELLGEKINLKGWKKYRGDITTEMEQDSYYTEWNGIEIMFHVSVWMNAEQHRRLIGNDVVFIIFHDCPLPSLSSESSLIHSDLTTSSRGGKQTTIPTTASVAMTPTIASVIAADSLLLGSRTKSSPTLPSLSSNQDDVFKKPALFWESLEIGGLDGLGTVPQIFGVVQEHPLKQDRYRVGFFSRPTIKPYPPPCPVGYIFHKSKLKDFLFTKAYNGYCQALSSPPMNRLYEVPRASAIADLIAKYPNDNKNRASKFRKRVSKKNSAPNTILHARIKDPLLLIVNVMYATLPGDEEYNNVVVQLLLNYDIQTKPTKCSPKFRPVWNECLSFNVVDINPASHSLCFNIIDLEETPKILGHCLVPLERVCKEQEQEVLLSLENNISLFVKFSLKGPASALCPVCSLYLGSSKIVIHKENKFHQECVRCSMCNRTVLGEDLKSYTKQFICKKCTSRMDLQEQQQQEDPFLSLAASITTITVTAASASPNIMATTSMGGVPPPPPPAPVTPKMTDKVSPLRRVVYTTPSPPSNGEDKEEGVSVSGRSRQVKMKKFRQSSLKAIVRSSRRF